MNSLLITIHIIACIALVVLVLLQSGKEGMGVIFGGGGGSLFGGSGAGGLLVKLTAGVATVFMVTSLTFTYLGTREMAEERQSIILDMPVEQQAAPAVPAAPEQK